MKKLLLLSLALSLIIFFVPLITFASFNSAEKEELHSENQQNFSTEEKISVYIEEQDKVQIMNFRDYITGVVAAEMPAVFHEEALSALACAAATLARLKMAGGENDALEGAVISSDPKKHQAYISVDEMKALWGNDFEKYYNTITSAVDRAIAYSITYEDELIFPAYHAMSSGVTEEAVNVWNDSIPYLVSVESKGDTLSPKYESVTTLSFDEFREIFEENESSFQEDITTWISDEQYSAAGTLLKVTIGEKVFSGEELREILSLRSSAITLSMTKDGVSLTTRGYGHGVGLSQYGADYLAKQGFSWQEIIKHYYTGVEIEIV